MLMNAYNLLILGQVHIDFIDQKASCAKRLALMDLFVKRAEISGENILVLCL